SNKKERARELKVNILSNNIFGVDHAADATNVARKRLWLWMLSGSDDDTPVKLSFSRLECNILNGNALIGWLDENIYDESSSMHCHLSTNIPSPSDITARLSRMLESTLNENERTKVNLEKYQPLHWRLVFNDLFKNDGKFNIIVGNPPYVFIRGRNFDEIEISYFYKWYFQGYTTTTKGKARQSGKINAFSLFIARSINLLDDGGILGFIVPNTLLRTTTNDIIRQFIINTSFIYEIVDLQDGVFDGVVASTIILILGKKNAEKWRKGTVVKHLVEDLLSGKYQSHEIDQERFPLNPACIFDIHVDDRFATMFSAMQRDTFPLEDACSEIIEGLVTRRGDNMFTTDPNAPNAKKLLRGKDIDRYKIEWHPGQYIIYDPAKLHRARPVFVHEAPVKLLAQRIGGGTYPLRVAYDDRQHYFFASINAIILKKEMNDANIEQEYKYILAILNSALMNAYYLLSFSNKSALTVNVSKTLLGSLPIKIATPAVRRGIAKIVDYMLFLNAGGSNETELREYIDKELLDVILYDLYTCQEQENDMLDTILSFFHEIDHKDSGRKGTIAIIKESIARIKADGDCMSWLLNIKNSTGFTAIKHLFEERIDGVVD
ncbi:MAG: TaqI-like C-terminal specificity domain-containing protein, partial [Candidatus Sigynarchaeota archaeon]